MQKLAATFLGTTVLAGVTALYFWQQLNQERAGNVATPYLLTRSEAPNALDTPAVGRITRFNRPAAAGPGANPRMPGSGAPVLPDDPPR